MSKKESTAKKAAIIGYITAAILLFAVVLVIPQSRAVFKSLSGAHPYLMGFAKFALLATAGELIAAYIANSAPTVPVKIAARFVIWGFIGVWITFMMKVFSVAAAQMMASGLLPAGL